MPIIFSKNKGEFNPIFYREDHFKLFEWNNFWLSEKSQIAGSRGWDAEGFNNAQNCSQFDPHGPVTTFHGFKGLENDNVRRIDYIFIKNDVRVYKYGVLCDRDEKGYPSDHFPVVVEVSVC
ncbi:MAG: hypothetical protein ACOCV3_06135 [Halanaerobiales bacterium]